MIREWLLRRAEAIMAARPHDFAIGPPDDRYCYRWFITPWSRYDRDSKPRNAWERFKRTLPNLYLHRFVHDDEDRALHCHPWSSVSVILKTGYWEVVPRSNVSTDSLIARPNDFFHGNVADVSKVFRDEGSITYRRAESPHRVVLLRAYPSARMVPREDMRPVEAVTLFFTWFRRRDWFFYCAKGPVPWQVFTSSRDRGDVGRGCE